MEIEERRMKVVDGRSMTSLCPTLTIAWHAIVGLSGLVLAAPAMAAVEVAHSTDKPAAEGPTDEPSPQKPEGRSVRQQAVEIEEIVVTATRREVSLQKLPEAVTAI